MTNPLTKRLAGTPPPFWYDDDYQGEIRLGLKVREVLHSSQSAVQRIEIIDTWTYGRVLVLDGVFQTSEVDEYLYHEMLVHPALAVAPKIARVLIIGGGDGGAAREVLRHGDVEAVVMVEIDQDVVAACQEHLASIGTAWRDPRLEVRIVDGVEYLRQADEGSYDVVILDGPDPVGPAEGLYSEEFYRSVARVLAPGGVFALHAESPVIVRDTFLTVLRSLRAAFPKVYPYLGSVPLYGTGPWAWALAGAGVDPGAIVEPRAQAVEASTRYYSRAIHRAAFILPNELERELAPLLAQDLPSGRCSP